MKATKTNRPRIVPLSPPLLQVLDDWRAELIRKQHPGLEKGWCFPSRKGGLRFTSTMTKPMKACVKKARLNKQVNVQGLRRSAEDILRRLGVAGAVAEAVMGHGRLMRHHYSTVANHEVASIGPRIVEAIGLDDVSPEFVGDRVGDRGAENENG